jgi:CO/xanthine dehydrogenase Mo-binding subunit
VPIHASGPYRIPHVRALTRAIHTHDSVAGAFRGFGVPQSTLLGERLIDALAARSGIDPLEFRYRNALVAGDATPTGQVLAASVGLRACLDALRRGALRMRWRQRSMRRRTGRRTTPATDALPLVHPHVGAAPASPACGTASATP